MSLKQTDPYIGNQPPGASGVPDAHAPTHESGGSDPIKLDDLAAPDDNTDLDASVSAHGLLKKLDGVTTNFLRGDGAWAVPAGGGSSIFGSRFQEVSSESESTNDTTTWSEKLTIDMPGDTPAGKYRIGWFYTWASTTQLNDFEGRVEIDDTTNVLTHAQEPQDVGTDQNQPVSGFAYVDLTAAAHTIDLDFRRSAGISGTMYIRQVRLEVWRIS
jgi:hypothetical protein